MRKGLKILTVIICILALLSVLGMLMMILNSDLDMIYKIEVISNAISLVFLLEYFLLGFKKDFASYYKLAMYVNAANALLVTAVSANETSKYISIISCAICFGIILTLAIAKNLGKNMSVVLCTVVIILRLSGLISYYLSTNSINFVFLTILSQLLLAIVILVATIAKYEDKALRHTS